MCGKTQIICYMKPQSRHPIVGICLPLCVLLLSFFYCWIFLFLSRIFFCIWIFMEIGKKNVFLNRGSHKRLLQCPSLSHWMLMLLSLGCISYVTKNLLIWFELSWKCHCMGTAQSFPRYQPVITLRRFRGIFAWAQHGLCLWTIWSFLGTALSQASHGYHLPLVVQTSLYLLFFFQCWCIDQKSRVRIWKK